jgi:hypothetical protein
MSNHLEHLARRLQDDPFFLACPLQLYAKSEGLSEEGLAAGLKCSKEALISVLLCRAPSGEHASFYEGIERVAARFSVDAGALADAVRRGQAIFHMARTPSTSNTLLAARDSDAQHGGDDKNGGRP